jgi:hypothetical protein
MDAPCRGRLIAALPVAVGLVVALAACAPRAGSLTVPTDSGIGSADGDMGALQGRLEGARSGDGAACFWVDGPNGRAFLVLRVGSYSTPDLELHPAAAQLSTLKIGETYLFSGAPDRGARAEGCSGEGAVWFTGQVQPENPDYARATLSPPKEKG